MPVWQYVVRVELELSTYPGQRAKRANAGERWGGRRSLSWRACPLEAVLGVLLVEGERLVQLAQLLERLVAKDVTAFVTGLICAAMW